MGQVSADVTSDPPPLLHTPCISRCVNYNATHQVRSPHLTSTLRCLSSRIPVVSLIGRKRKINMMININISINIDPDQDR